MKPFKLNEFKKQQTGFTVPEGYFESFSQKFTTEHLSKPNVIALSRNKRNWYASFAAVFVIGLGIFISQLFSEKTPMMPDAVAIENYLASQRSTEDNLADLLDTEDLSNIYIDQSLDTKAIEDILVRNPNLEQYLIN